MSYFPIPIGHLIFLGNCTRSREQYHHLRIGRSSSPFLKPQERVPPMRLYTRLPLLGVLYALGFADTYTLVDSVHEMEFGISTRIPTSSLNGATPGVDLFSCAIHD